MFKNKIILSILFLILVAVCFGLYWHFNLSPVKPNYKIGQPIDSLNGVIVYYNGCISNVSCRNISPDGYNLGKKHQWVEFVKRYYYEHLNHRMPNSWGHAKDFYEQSLKDGEYNNQRNLTQYSNPSISKPKVNDIIVFSGTNQNKYGHVAIISKVTSYSIEIIQQNLGVYASSREKITLTHCSGKWASSSNWVLGWLKKK
jgi:hypothetical protein